MPKLLCSLLLSLLLFASPFALAELSISLPLGPYYRPGKYIPVHVTASVLELSDAWVGVAADNVSSKPTDLSLGAGRTSINLRQGRIDAIVPWLVLDGRAKRPRLFIEDRPEFVDGSELKLLEDSERLVGWTTPDEAFARQLLPGSPKIIPVALDPSEPIKGHAAAWEMFDAIILDATSAMRLDQAQLASLLACGVTVAVRSDTPPFPAWPWKRMGEYAVLQYDPVGPATAGFHKDVYLPVDNWQAGWPWPFRRRVLLLAAVSCLLLLGLTLWRPPLTPLWAVLLVAIMLFGIGKWWNTQLAIQQAAGEIVVFNDDGLTQTDDWTYQTAVAARDTTLRWSDVSRPMVADDIWVSLNCDVTGRPTEFFTHLPANRKVAFLARTVGPRGPRTPPAKPVTSPLAALVDKQYLQGGGQITGQLPGAPQSSPAVGYVDVEQWNAIVVDRRKQP
ncbi:MAG: hypothetical protein JWN40_1318 [Phycisphaerales bacterium]|nr:hypothetical protein [Phycisphaerales bacterium]